MMDSVDWHFPRAELTERVYSLLINGPMQGVSICGPGRTGKTRFLTHDLAPFAKRNGHHVIHVDFSQTSNSPLEILLYELDRALRSRGLLGHAKSLASRAVSKFMARTIDHPAKSKIDTAKLKKKAPLDNLLLLLDQCCERLANDRKPTFLLFDEFLEVEREEDAKSLIAALRASIQRRRSGLVAVFTASSQSDLRQIFSNRAAPFFQFASFINLPPMPDDFVDHQLKALNGLSKGTLERERAIGIFHRFDRNPLFFQRWLLTVASNPNMPDSDSINAVQESLAQEFGFSYKWLSLNPTQRIMARVFTNPVGQVYGEEADELIASLTGQKPPPKPALQEAIGILSKLHIIDKSDQKWRIGDPLFESWIKSRPASEFSGTQQHYRL